LRCKRHQSSRSSALTGSHIYWSYVTFPNNQYLFVCDICKNFIIWSGCRFNSFAQRLNQWSGLCSWHVLITLHTCFYSLQKTVCSHLRWSHEANTTRLMGLWKKGNYFMTLSSNGLSIVRLVIFCRGVGMGSQSCYKWFTDLFTITVFFLNVKH